MTIHKIKKLGHLGEGVTEDGFFAALTVPGDELQGSVDGTHLTNTRIAKPSSLRIKPICQHFKSCGGCKLQHVKEDYVADWKAGIVEAALNAQGIETEIRPTVTSAAKSRRRATLTARRTKSGAIVGFHAHASDVIVPVTQCELIHSELMNALPLCKEMAVLGASRKNGLSVTLTRTENGLDISVRGGKSMEVQLQASLARLAEDNNVARVVWEGEVAALRAPSTISFDGIAVPLPPGAFLQATAHGEHALRKAVAEIMGSARHIIDFFSGCGTFALPMARNAEILALEGERTMIDALIHGWRHAEGLKAVRAKTQDLFRNPLQANEFGKSHAVILDPPRAGAEAQVNEIAKSRVERVAHVSCNARTFARDSKTLTQAGFNLQWVQPVDQFRWSHHVEIVGAFER